MHNKSYVSKKLEQLIIWNGGSKIELHAKNKYVKLVIIAITDSHF
jgi:hypothetical protein